MTIHSLDELITQGLQNRYVLVRSDLNVPIDPCGNITDPWRITASIPTLKILLEHGAKVILITHLGRPKSQEDTHLSLAPVAKILTEQLGQTVSLANDVVGPDAQRRASQLLPGEILLLENVRFDPRETSRDDSLRRAFASQLVHLASAESDFSPAYISDGFGVIHRKHASVYDIAYLLPHYAGQLLATELDVLKRLMHDSDHPYAVVLGGSKISDKLGVIESLATQVDSILIGGGMCFTFLAAQGLPVGNSIVETDMLDACSRLLDTYGDMLHLPVDITIANAFDARAQSTIVPINGIPDGWMGLDIGPESVHRFSAVLDQMKTIFWNGPMGVFEFPAFAGGTRGLAHVIAQATAQGAYSVIGGGDSAAALRTLGFEETSFSYISTGGGASLEYLEGKTLPGITALSSVIQEDLYEPQATDRW